MSIIDNIMGVLTFNKDKMETIANEDRATVPAFLIAIMVTIFGTIPVLLDFLGLDTSDLLSSDRVLTAIIIIFFAQLLILFVFAGLMGFILRGFGGTATLIQSLRVYGFCMIWPLIGYIFDLVLLFVNMDNLAIFGFLLGLIGLLSLVIGFASFSGLEFGSAFFAAIIAYIITAYISSYVVFNALIRFS